MPPTTCHRLLKVNQDLYKTLHDHVIMLYVEYHSVLPRLCCDAIPQQDFNPMLFPISVQFSVLYHSKCIGK